MLGSILFKPSLPEERLQLQKNTRMGITNKAVAVYKTSYWQSRFEGECIVPEHPPRGIFDTSSPDESGHLCVLVRGSLARALDELSLEPRRGFLLGPLLSLLGLEILRPLEWYEKAWHREELCGGGYVAIPLVGTVEGFLPMPHTSIGDTHWAGTKTAHEHAGYIEVAIQSGQHAAREVSL
jgi:monoamine oxidase